MIDTATPQEHYAVSHARINKGKKAEAEGLQHACAAIIGSSANPADHMACIQKVMSQFMQQQRALLDSMMAASQKALKQTPKTKASRSRGSYPT